MRFSFVSKFRERAGTYLNTLRMIQVYKIAYLYTYVWAINLRTVEDNESKPPVKFNDFTHISNDPSFAHADNN